MELRYAWGNSPPAKGISFECPHCGVFTTPLRIAQSSEAWLVESTSSKAVGGASIYACTGCTAPVIFENYLRRFFPSPRLGHDIKRLPAAMESLYNEARDASSVRAYTGCAMLARKILMNLAVLEGAKENLNFQTYVTYLSDNGFVPKKGKPWVDRIRQKGNEATHEIELTTEADAKDIMFLVENLLRFNFEMNDEQA